VARIAGVDLPRDLRVEFGLCKIYGLGLSSSRQILREAGVKFETRVRNPTEAEVSKISAIITSNYKVEGDLRREVAASIKRLMDIGCYRGLRHRRGLPVRGQRTRTNARTRKGPRKPVGSKKKETK